MSEDRSKEGLCGGQGVKNEGRQEAAEKSEKAPVVFLDFVEKFSLHLWG